MADITKIHDKYFKSVFSRKDVALDMLRMLNSELLNNLDLQTFQLSNASFIDEDLKESFADLVYNCQTTSNKKVQISFIYEHKSYIESYPHLQLLHYFLNVWNENKKQKAPLTTLIPIIIYHGQKHWDFRGFDSYFSTLESDYQDFIPNFKYLLFNISLFSNQEIENFENKFLAMSSLVMKYTQRVKKVEEMIENFVNLFENIENDSNFVETTILYLTQVNEIKREEFLLIFKKTTIKIKNRMLSVYDQLIQEGRMQGLSQGLSEGLRLAYSNAVKNLSKKGYSKEQVIDNFIIFFELPKKEASKIVNEIMSKQVLPSK